MVYLFTMILPTTILVAVDCWAVVTKMYSELECDKVLSLIGRWH